MKTFAAFLAALLGAPAAWAQETAAHASPRGADAFDAALVVSAQALLVIFVIMAFFGAMIHVIGRLLPGKEE